MSVTLSSGDARGCVQETVLKNSMEGQNGKVQDHFQ